MPEKFSSLYSRMLISICCVKWFAPKASRIFYLQQLLRKCK